MRLPDGKPDVVELARAQLDFAAMNSAAPTAKEVLLKAQTLVPMSPQVPWEKYAAGAGIAALLCAALLLPWVPQWNLVSVAGVQFDALIEPTQAQQIINRAISAMNDPDRGALLSASYAPQKTGGGMLMLKATAFGERSSALSQRLGQAISGAANMPAFTPYQIGELTRAYRLSPLALMTRAVRSLSSANSPAAFHPAAALAMQTRASEPVLRAELEHELQQHGYALSGFAFAVEGALLPAGCQFKLPAWPEPVALGVRGYLKMSSFQQDEVRSLAAAWIERMNLTGSGLLLDDFASKLPVVAEVLDQAGRVDSLLTARVNAAIKQPTPLDLARSESSVEQAVSAAASTVLSGIERRVEFERLSARGELPRYRVRISMLGRAEPELQRASDPVDDSSVREEW